MLDVFAMEKYGGNGLAVFRDAADLAEDEMQAIAREMNQAETTFILSDSERDGGYDVRIFSPEKELPFAGHPTLGTVYTIQQEIVKKPVEQIALNLKAGQIPVSLNFEGDKLDILWMKQKPATFGKKFSADAVAKIVGLNAGDIDDNFPVQEASSGLPFIIVPVKSLEALIKAKPDGNAILEFVEQTDGKAVVLFCGQTYFKENDLNMRAFNEYYGVSEDAACGSGVGSLAGYLVKYSYFDTKNIDLRVEQGYEIGRPSLLFIKADNEGDQINVQVGGRCIPLAQGQFG
jgi:trans-2,3-dihydro-3-hydroxyanthranilate isomerase